jgi:hypothetical protein
MVRTVGGAVTMGGVIGGCGGIGTGGYVIVNVTG